VSSKCDFNVGDLVEYRSWYDGDGGWVSAGGMIGVVLEIIKITCQIETGMFEDGDTLYDVKVFWYTEDATEFIPDLLLEHYDPNNRIIL